LATVKEASLRGSPSHGAYIILPATRRLPASDFGGPDADPSRSHASVPRDTRRPRSVENV